MWSTRAPFAPGYHQDGREQGYLSVFERKDRLFKGGTTFSMKTKHGTTDNQLSVFCSGRNRPIMLHSVDKLHCIFKNEGMQNTFHSCLTKIYMQMFHVAKLTTTETTWESRLRQNVDATTHLISMEKTKVPDRRVFFVVSNVAAVHLDRERRPSWSCTYSLCPADGRWCHEAINSGISIQSSTKWRVLFQGSTGIKSGSVSFWLHTSQNHAKRSTTHTADWYEEWDHEKYGDSTDATNDVFRAYVPSQKGFKICVIRHVGVRRVQICKIFEWYITEKSWVRTYIDGLCGRQCNVRRQQRTTCGFIFNNFKSAYSRQ